VPLINAAGHELIVSGRFLKVAGVRDAEWLDGSGVEDPELCITALKRSPIRPDVFRFAQPLGDPEPKHKYPLDWDNVAAVPITSYADWWENRLTQVSRKNVRRAQRRGVVARVVPFDDPLVRGIMQIYNETPIRQGRRFWHYGKDFDTVKRENSSFLDRSEFVAAYFQDELIGFIKIVFANRVGRIMQILSMNQHADKRTPNALIAKAMEVCCERGASYFVYGKYVYDSKEDSPLIEFKRRNGFEQVMIPTYNVPLTLKGRMALALRLHLGVKRMLPKRLLSVLRNARARHYEKQTRHAVRPAQEGDLSDRGLAEA